MFAFEMKQRVKVKDGRDVGIVVGRDEYIYKENQYHVRLYPPAQKPEGVFSEAQLLPEFTQASEILQGERPTAELAEPPRRGDPEPQVFNQLLDEVQTQVVMNAVP